MEIVHRLQQSIGTCIGIGIGSNTNTVIGSGTCTGAKDVDYHLAAYGLV